jgi:hypothetical protein
MIYYNISATFICSLIVLYYSFKAQWLLYVPPHLTFEKMILPTESIYEFHMVLRINKDDLIEQH